MLNAPLLRISLWLGVVGFPASLGVHAAAIFGRGTEAVVYPLHLGVFAAFAPIVFGLVGLAKRKGIGSDDGRAQRDFQLAFLGSLPLWQKGATAAVTAYAVANFLGAFGNGVGPGELTVRLFSGHWLLLYLLSAVLASGLLREADALAPPRGV